MRYDNREIWKIVLWIFLSIILTLAGVLTGLHFIWKIFTDIPEPARLSWYYLLVIAGVPLLVILTEVATGMVISTWATWVRCLDPVTIDVLIPHLEHQREILKKDAEAEDKLTDHYRDRKVEKHTNGGKSKV